MGAAPNDLALVRIVNWWYREFFFGDVAPDVELCPVADRKDANIFAGVEPRVVQTPKLGPLAFRIPLAELIAKRKNSLFRARFFFVTARPANAGVKAELGDGIEQGYRLMHVSALVWRV